MVSEEEKVAGNGPRGSVPSASSTAGSDDLPTVSELIERMGFGFAQLRASFIGGGVFLADGAELLLISSVATAVSDDWQLSALQRGTLVTTVFLGMLLGNLASGLLSEVFGRREVLNLSFLGLSIFSISSSFAMGFRSLASLRLCVGTCIGLGQPAWTALGTEIMPVAWRIWASSAVFWLFTVGEIYTSCLLVADDPALEKLHWRSLLRYGAVPACVLCVGSFFLLSESPVFLAARGMRAETTQALISMRRDNCAPEVSLDFRAPREPSPDGSPVAGSRSCTELLLRQFEVIFSRKLRASTIIVMYSCFVLNFNYYGCLYAFPQVLKSVLPSRAPATALLVGALWEFPGTAVGLLLGFVVSRKLGMKVYLLSTVAATIAFLLGAGAVARGSSNVCVHVLLYSGYYGLKSFGNSGFAIVYTYAAELYPTEARATGTAVNLAGGRIGSMMAPLVFELLSDFTGTYRAFFSVIIFCSLLNCVLVDVLKYETANALLKDAVDEPEDADIQRWATKSAGGPSYGTTPPLAQP
mmetsp:Transcript_7004/g.19879  ORF Transcript_7004/g.19879 Transcript_7004/m.19879 type:complete len:527 (+) Transcript_7004:277-1857(+)|eukprot:CAMPEP_0170275962 /NCGR_PEP_ID=MMETSP0116_2-20130129/37965_1 /TAXON_ID=400756 /ORGANISM="Durinskia baltica, Strain CSIRO CS-38" /LENGTH=526 /DNA_ID=CAMNT_0010527233 /DNA_START=180 /DNA_END=1760 /DNA_ORIENTATION=-